MEGVEVEDPPAGWQRCDGSTILEPSIWAGERTPDLNNERRFLRGGSDREVLTLEEDMVQDHGHEVNDPGHTHSYEDSIHIILAAVSTIDIFMMVTVVIMMQQIIQELPSQAFLEYQ